MSLRRRVINIPWLTKRPGAGCNVLQISFGGRRLVVGSETCVVGGGRAHPAVSLHLRDPTLFDQSDLVQVTPPFPSLPF